MATDKQCPFLKTACIKEECAMWVKNITVSLSEPGGEETVRVSPLCAIRAAGLAGLPAIGKSFYSPE